MVKTGQNIRFQNGVDELGPVPELEPVPVLGPPSDLLREIRARALIRTFTVLRSGTFERNRDCTESHMKKVLKCQTLLVTCWVLGTILKMKSQKIKNS